MASVKEIKQLAGWVGNSQRAVIFTGAGISTESGIPDFRSPGGVWAKYKPVYFSDFVQSESARHEYWRQKCEAHQEFAAAAPNAGHKIIANWEGQGRIRGVVTQNIDGLHQIAGSQRVLEIHGTAREAVCLECGRRVPIQPCVDEFVKTDQPPRCNDCQGPLKHATISFGQSLDESTLLTAQQWMMESDLVLVLGSSLVVHPAAGLPAVAQQQGAKLAIINRDATPLDSSAQMVLHESLGETLRLVDAEMKSS